MLVIFEHSKGFIEFDLVNSVITYSMNPSTAELFDTHTQAQFCIKSNNLGMCTIFKLDPSLST